ncbi:unnamed protein product [Ixodes pacificus]
MLPERCVIIDLRIVANVFSGLALVLIIFWKCHIYVRPVSLLAPRNLYDCICRTTSRTYLTSFSTVP